MERIFILHEGIKGFIRSYWELLSSEPGASDPLTDRISKGEVAEAGIVVAFPPLPYAWATGRFFALFSVGEDNHLEWKEVTKQVQHDTQMGLDQCPDWLRPRYRSLVVMA